MDSIIAKFDPQYRHQYICENEIDAVDQTIFILKPLTIFEYRFCEEISLNSNMSIGGFALKTLEFGLVGWDNFEYDEDEVIPYSIENFSAIPMHAQSELSSKILELSEPDEKLVDELKFVAKWSSWVSKTKNPSQWDCDFCSEKGFQNARNCGGDLPNKCPRCKHESHLELCPRCGAKLNPHFKFRFSNELSDFVTRCPLSIITNRSVKLTNLIMFMNESTSLPFSGGSLEQTNFFYSVRSTVLSEQNMILKEELNKEDKGK